MEGPLKLLQLYNNVSYFLFLAPFKILHTKADGFRIQKSNKLHSALTASLHLLACIVSICIIRKVVQVQEQVSKARLFLDTLFGCLWILCLCTIVWFMWKRSVEMVEAMNLATALMNHVDAIQPTLADTWALGPPKSISKKEHQSIRVRIAGAAMMTFSVGWVYIESYVYLSAFHRNYNVSMDQTVLDLGTGHLDLDLESAPGFVKSAVGAIGFVAIIFGELLTHFSFAVIFCFLAGLAGCVGTMSKNMLDGAAVAGGYDDWLKDLRLLEKTKILLDAESNLLGPLFCFSTITFIPELSELTDSLISGEVFRSVAGCPYLFLISCILGLGSYVHKELKGMPEKLLRRKYVQLLEIEPFNSAICFLHGSITTQVYGDHFGLNFIFFNITFSLMGTIYGLIATYALVINQTAGVGKEESFWYSSSSI